MRNGEGVRHVIRVSITSAASPVLARALGKAIVNAPLFKCAVAGNDPNVGRLVQAIGKHIGAFTPKTDMSKLRASMGGVEIFANGVFQLNPEKEAALVAHLRSAELYASAPQRRRVFRADRFPAARALRGIGHRCGQQPDGHGPWWRSHPRIRERERRLPELSATVAWRNA